MLKQEIAKPMPNAFLIYRFVSSVFPRVKAELERWREYAQSIPDSVLSAQALASIEHKSFHCQGGSIYALYPGTNIQETVEFIVAYQTISDYLDNLVDSLEVRDEKSFVQLHLAMEEALVPEGINSDYYLYYPYKNDGGYLEALVNTCRRKVANLPAYPAIKKELLKLAGLYGNLQTYKHLNLSKREDKMLHWAGQHLKYYPQISAWEFGAASGSTLGIFCLYAAAFDPELTKERAVLLTNAYFPWICGLHILLDYFIDLKEDRSTEQLNFVQYYADSVETRTRLETFVTKALKESGTLIYPKFHRAVIQGLLAMYLSDDKGTDPDIAEITGWLLNSGGLPVKTLYRICCKLRNKGII